MCFNKKTLALAVSGVLGTGGLVAPAFAVVDMDTGNGTPVSYASELTIPAGGLNLVEPATAPPATDAFVLLGVAVPDSTALPKVYARFDVENGSPSAATFANAPQPLVVTYPDYDGTAGSCASGTANANIVVGGALSSFVIYEIPAALGGGAGCGLTADTKLDFSLANAAAPGVKVPNANTTGLRYRLFGSQGNAQDLVGTPNKDRQVPYIAFAPGFTLTTTPNTSVSDAGATPPFTRFVNNQLTANIGGFNLAITTPNPGGLGVFLNNGAVVNTLNQLIGAGSTLGVVGDFSARAATNGVLRGVCNPLAGTTANPITDTAATFELAAGDLGVAAILQNVCYTVNGTTAIPTADYTIAFTGLVPVTPGIGARSIAAIDLGKVVRNGTVLKAPLVQRPSGYTSRLVLVNTGTVTRNYTVQVYSENVNGTVNVATLNPALATGTLPPGNQILIDISQLISSFSNPDLGSRAAISVAVNAPNTQVEGAIQLLNNTSRTPTTYVMPEEF